MWVGVVNSALDRHVIRCYGNRVTCKYIKVQPVAKLKEMATVVRQKHSPTKFAPSDWKTSNFVIASSAERQRSTAHDIRQQSLKLRNDTGV